MCLKIGVHFTALLPVRMPERAVVVGVESMDATGSALGHAVRGENGLGLRDVPALARRLRDRIMELRIVWTRAPLPEGMYCWQAAEKRIGSDEPKRVHVLGFRCSDVEFRRLRASADACRLPVSAFTKRNISPARVAVVRSLISKRRFIK